jgi:hypothetical protein
MRASFIILLSLVGQMTFAQETWGTTFTYKGTVESKNVKVDVIELPTWIYLYKYYSDEFEEITSEQGPIKSGQYEINMVATFGNSNLDLVETYFKKKKYYPVKVFEKKKNKEGGYNSYEFQIPVEQIKFSTSDGDIIIEMPLIKIGEE